MQGAVERSLELIPLIWDECDIPEKDLMEIEALLRENDLEEYTYTVCSENYQPGRPAKTYGEPEDCHPEEPAEWDYDTDPEEQANLALIRICHFLPPKLTNNYVAELRRALAVSETVYFAKDGLLDEEMREEFTHGPNNQE